MGGRERERGVEEEEWSARERERRSGIASTLAVPQWYRAATPPFAPAVPLLPLLCPTHPAYIIHPHYEPPLGSVIALYSLLRSLERVRLRLSLRLSHRFLSFSTLPRFLRLLLLNLVFSRLPCPGLRSLHHRAILLLPSPRPVTRTTWRY